VNDNNSSRDKISRQRKRKTKKLSQRQFECMCYMLQGMTANQIAVEMCLSPRTIEGYIDIVKNKLGCKNRYEIIKKLLGDDFPWQDFFATIKMVLEQD
jgi:DNA-binding CsgD family transcriptional regulator